MIKDTATKKTVKFYFAKTLLFWFLLHFVSLRLTDVSNNFGI